MRCSTHADTHAIGQSSKAEHVPITHVMARLRAALRSQEGEVLQSEDNDNKDMAGY